jgi:hypothetical protein
MESLTPEQIADLKVKHGEIFKLTVGDKSCIMKEPNRKTLKKASAVATQDPMAFNEVILKECFVMGDTEIRDNDAYFLGASAKLSELIQIKEAALEKL